MRKLFLFLILFVFIFSANAQKDLTKKLTPINTKKIQKVLKKDMKIIPFGSKVIPIGVPIGLTNYDLQSNSSVAKRMINFGDGTLSAVWTQYHGSAMPSAPGRGTGYNHYDGTSWIFTDLAGNNVTIEGAQRTGWANITTDGLGNEFVYNHFRAAGGNFGWKQAIGTSNTGWTQQDAAIGEPVTWPRVAQSGQNIVIIGAGETNVSGQGIHNIVVMRSTDNGVSFTDITSSIDFSNQLGTSGDIYAITARDDVFAFVIFQGMNDLSMWKSEDAGATWNRTEIIDLPIVYDPAGGTLYDQNTDGIADVVMVTDGTGDIVIDSNGKVHVVFARMNSSDSDPSTSGNSFYPYTDYILYWNEGMGAGKYTPEALLPGFSDDNPYHIDSLNMSLSIDTIGWFPDLNANGEMDFPDVGAGEYPFGMYYGALSSFPNMGIDANDNIYVSYSTVMEGADYLKSNATPNAEQYKHLWVTKYNGESWGAPTLVTEVDGKNAENVYATMATLVDDDIHLWVQWDNEPGCSLQDGAPSAGTIGDPVTDNYVVYKKIPVTEIPDGTEMTHNVTFNVVYGDSDLPLENANVVFAYGGLKTNASGSAVYTNIHEQEYSYTVSYDGCPDDMTGVITASGDMDQLVDMGDCIVSTNDINKKQISIYPNPAGDFIKIINAGTSEVSIYNIVGAEVYSKIVLENEQINIKDFTRGTYFVKISNEYGTTTQKLIIK